MTVKIDAEEYDPLVRENGGRIEIKINGNTMSVDLRTIHGRMAARMLAYSIQAEDPGLARAILHRVGLEG
jgi:hypothetical protein